MLERGHAEVMWYIHVHDNEVCSALCKSTLLTAIYGNEDYANEIDCTAIAIKEYKVCM